MLDWKIEDDDCYCTIYKGCGNDQKVFCLCVYAEEEFVEISIPRTDWRSTYFDIKIQSKYIDKFINLLQHLLDVTYDKCKDITNLFDGYEYYIEIHCLLQGFNEVGHII